MFPRIQSFTDSCEGGQELEKVNWSFQENFYFPESFGTPTGTTLVEVKPRFEFQQKDGYCCLNGIYHISAYVAFEPGQCEHHGISDWVSIEDLEMNGEHGYFEYAVPHSIELPADYNQSQKVPEFTITQIDPIVTNDKTLQINWAVDCAYERLVQPELAVEESSSSSSSSSSSHEVIESSEVTGKSKPFFLKELKETYSVYQVK